LNPKNLNGIFTMGNFTDYLTDFRWLWHVGFWIMYGISRLFQYYLTILYYEDIYLQFMLLTDLSIVVVVYATLWLYKNLQLKFYLISGLVLWLLYLGFVVLFQKYYLSGVKEIDESSFWNLYFPYLTKYLMTFIILSLAKYFKDNFVQYQLENRQKKLQTQYELEHLKSQISPHFLFNTMNNFYGLAVQKSDKLPELMVKLSNLLRYSLYETKKDSVQIFQEITHLQNFISLDRIRLEDDLLFDFSTNITSQHKETISPLLLVVFVENAFKHSRSSMTKQIEIKISAYIDENSCLSFNVFNTCGVEKHSGKDVGIGLENVKRRLNVLYPGDLHTLKIMQEENYFEVDLKMKL
jgi:sensor histidine kinase YesM